MELQCVCNCWLSAPKTRLTTRPFFSRQIVSARNGGSRWGKQSVPTRVRWVPGFKRICGEPLVQTLGGVVVCASNSNRDAELEKPRKDVTNNVPLRKLDRMPFRGKSGSVSFFGLTYQVVEESKLESAPFKEGTGSLVWVLAPIALLSSLLLPPFFLANAIDAVFKDEILAELIASISSELIFYVGLAAFLFVTNHVQRPYLQISPKRWGLITGLRGYLSSAFFAMGLKVIAPLLAVYVTWPVLGLPALVAVAPFLVGCAAQFAFERYVDKQGSSCWPLVPIIFEVYRVYQLTKAVHFIEKLLFSMREAPASPAVLDRNGALVALVVTFQFLGALCLWSLITFLMRLFPSRPVAENY